MANPRERTELFLWADRIAAFFAGAMQGKAEQYQKFEKTRREPALKNGKKHDSQERIANIMIYKKTAEKRQNPRTPEKNCRMNRHCEELHLWKNHWREPTSCSRICRMNLKNSWRAVK